ncbi:DUF5906 domain-containing protein [Dendrosporobacter sp. 1207_IL3150]|uniref:DUF5906 domain-containing protein n=1 Tax=Dendrosporobacter sp. 1207_IL3150 TaxID=3084054 RepID=UPI002FD9BFEA
MNMDLNTEQIQVNNISNCVTNDELKSDEISTNRKKVTFMYHYKGSWQVNYAELHSWFARMGHKIIKDDFKKVDNILYGWDGKRWTRADDFIKKFIFLKFMNTFGIAIDSKYLSELINTCLYADFIPSIPRWDWSQEYANKLIITFLNGTLEIDFTNYNHKFYKNIFRKENNAVYILNMNYEEELMAANYWRDSFVGKYFLEYYADNDRDQLQQYLAAVLIPQFEIQQNLVILGDGGDGKGVLMGALRDLLGNVVSGLRVSEWDGKHDTTALIGSILNITSERPSREINTDIFKAVVANDELQMNPKFKDLFYHKPFCKHIMTVNSLPSIEIDSAIMRRLVMIKTCKTTTMRERNASFKRNFELDKAGLVSFMIQGLYLLKANDFNFLTGSIELKDELIYQNDSLIKDFIDECISLTDNINDYEVSAFAFDLFSYWERDNGKNSKPMVRATFSKKIINISKSLGMANVVSVSRRLPDSGKTARVLTGIKIKSEWVANYNKYKKSLENFMFKC